MNKNDQAPTRVVGALVVQVNIEDWPTAKRAIEATGARIVFQRIAPLSVHLYIVERPDPGADA